LGRLSTIRTNTTGAVVSRHDYVPFGEELQASSSAGNRNLVFGFGVSPSERDKFTGKERDGESGLDYFGARYLASTQGRFTSVDPANAGAYPSNPQTWNGYA
jgi:RHS repeat-associated protein